MRVETNTKLAERNRKLANYLFLSTLFVLIAGFFFVNASTFDPSGEIDTGILFLQALVLPTAFIMTLISIRMTNLWARPPRPEKVLPEALKSLSKKSVLYNYYHLPIRHLLICPQGVFVIVTRWHDGRFEVKNDQWKTLANPISRFLSTLRLDGIGNPTEEAVRLAQAAVKLLEPHAPGVEVKPIIVFVNPRARLTIENPSIPVVYADTKNKPNLKDLMRDLYLKKSGDARSKSALPLTDEQIASFEKATLPASS